MTRNMDEEIAGWRRELKDLEEAISWEDPPLAPRSRAIAEAKIATLQLQPITPSRAGGLIGIGGRLTAPPLPHHLAYGSVPRRFDRVELQLAT
jgi:hypothetical protein